MVKALAPRRRLGQPYKKIRKNRIKYNSGFHYPKIGPLRASPTHIVGQHIATSEDQPHVVNTAP
jgi:hypothetical protein